MIRINLLPVKEEKLLNEGKSFLILIAILLVIMVIPAVWFSIVFKHDEALLEGRIKSLDKNLATLKIMVGEISSLKRKEMALKEKIKTIQKLQEENVGPVRALDEISLKMPSNKIWLTSLDMNGGKVKLEGKTLENQEVAAFMKLLDKSRYFANVELNKIERNGEVKGIPILSFSMSAKVYYAGKEKAKKQRKARGKKAKRGRNR